MSWMSSGAKVAVIGLVSSLGILLGCQGKAEKTQKKPADEVLQLSPNEKQRGREACATYIERLCRCAQSHPEYQKECELIRNARPDALDKAIAASETVDDANVRWRTQVTARRIMSRCIEDDNRLDLVQCPRVPAVKPEQEPAAGGAPE
jgi:hypothetical protein